MYIDDKIDAGPNPPAITDKPLSQRLEELWPKIQRIRDEVRAMNQPALASQTPGEEPFADVPTMAQCPVCWGDSARWNLECIECMGQGMVNPEDYAPGEYASLRYLNR